MRTIYAIDWVTLDGVRLSDVLSLSVWADQASSMFTGVLTQTGDRVTRLTGNWCFGPREDGLPRLVSPKDRLIVQFRKEIVVL